MIKIEVQSLPLFEVIRDIAAAFEVDYQENCGEYHVDIPSNLGEGFIKGINFDGGFGILIYQCKFNDDLEFHFVVDHIHPLKFLYCLNGVLHHRFQDSENNNTIEQYQSSIVASKSTNGHILHFTADTYIQVGSLEVDREKFKNKVNCELRSLSPELKKLFLDSMALNEFYHNGYYSLQIADLFTKIQSFENNDFIRRIFLEGQAYSVLTHQIVQYHDDISEEDKSSVLRSYEILQIKKAAKLIDYDLADLDSVEKIAEEVGLNINKLQLGFKHLYQTTVNGYVQQKRMVLARNLLNNTDYNISEIVGKIGLSSKSYFSKIFKETYDISPSEYRKNNKILRDK
ncbi:helix-turn-helix domain-containing protein [Rasiella sp. SM2506]|uniref:helix-turn-helix domain-containing protein n=1 Tax=Rasiella sp. SM2506 TaxID=3423914 RepID=UPI003D798CF7